MDYRIRRAKAELDSTGYMEIGPGKYSGAHWQDGFLFIWEDAFGMAEGIVARHFPSYDQFAMNDVPKLAGENIIADWLNVGQRLADMTADQAHVALNLKSTYHERLHSEIAAHRADIETMMQSLAEECARFYEKEDWICILGM